MSLNGQIAPDFTLPRDGGGEITLSSLRPQKVVLYFYPRDDTSGCTREALDFTEHQPAFDAARTVIVGVSKDTVRKHNTFIAKHGLGVILASDAESDVCERYGTWIEKSMYGRKFMGVVRSTFLIDADGKLRKEWRNVKVKGHAEAVLEAVKAL
mgnify:CR=1 FL=1